ncbi:hypothetical protein TWF730_004362 [Orbilia blumenaviensis]|uniref:Nephrocystin 3-like N-terminal domain-containing protein n=1 Tax=Orbilia blumenaviensis TaxID=1796055 RepID=A0AAV9TYI0_9PEZI
MDPTSSAFHNPECNIGVQAASITNTGVINVNTANKGTKTVRLKLTPKDVLSILRKALAEKDEKDRNPDRVPGTCEWFTTHKAFKDWEASPLSKILWVSADPGSGKSVLAKYLVDYVLKGPRTICYFFFKNDFEGQDRAITALSCILFQLFDEKRKSLSKEIIERFEIAGEGFSSSFKELWSALITATKINDTNTGEIVCVLDALDECNNDDRSLLIGKLGEFCKSENKSNLKFLITSRPISKIRNEFYESQPSQLSLIHLSGETEAEVEKISHEIGIFIKAKVKSIKKKFSLTDEMANIMLKRLTVVPNRTYLWVHLTLNLVENSLGREININKDVIVDIISSLPATVDEAYERILSTNIDIEKTRLLLKILVAAARPLRLREISLVMQLAVEDLCSYQGLDINSEQSKGVEQRISNYLRNLCGLFVVVVQSTVYFIHQTAKEFLVADERGEAHEPVIQGLQWRNSLRVSDCQKVLFRACFRHLFFAEFESDPLPADGVSQYTEKYVLLNYSANHWTTHLRNAQMKLQGEDVQKALSLCDTNLNRCLTWFRVYWTSTGSKFPEGITPLILASYCGLGEVVRIQLGSWPADKIGINATDGTYRRSALSWAAERGYDGIVSDILEIPIWRMIPSCLVAYLPSIFRREAEVNAQDRYMRTPLTYAVWGGHIPIIKALVGAGAQVDLQDDIKGTPLSYAVCSGRGDVIKLLKRDGQVSINSDVAVELLFSAVGQGRDDVIEYLLETAGVNPNQTGRDGMTALSKSAGEGNYETCKVLIRHGAAVEAKDTKGKTAIMHSVLSGSIRTVRLFLKSGANVEENFPSGETLLESAWNKGYDEVIWALIQAGANVESGFHGGQTPLVRAVKRGSAELAEALVRRGANVEAKDEYGETPLINAVRKGNISIIQLLLKNGANANAATNKSQTPLINAVRGGNISIIRLLLKNGANANAATNEGQTPLIDAVQGGNISIIRLLLKNGANANAATNEGQTPLIDAVRGGNIGIVRLLLKNGANANVATNEGQTPLMDAVRGIKIGIVQLLLENGANTNTTTSDGWTPLMDAIEGTKISIVRMLLANGANVNAMDSEGWTPLLNAAKKGNTLTVRLLLTNGANTRAIDTKGYTPLIYAARQQNAAVIRLLLDSGADVNAADAQNNTALHYTVNYDAKSDTAPQYTMSYYAKKYGSWESISRQLLDSGASTEATNNMHQTPLFRTFDCKCLLLLMDRGADIDKTDFTGCTPLFYQLDLWQDHEWERRIKALVDRGADIKTRLIDGKQRSLLYEAICLNLPDLVQVLLDRGADIEERKPLGLTPLFYAILKAKPEYDSGLGIVKQLLERGAKRVVEDVCVEGQTVKLLDPFVKAVQERSQNQNMVQEFDSEFLSYNAQSCHGLPETGIIMGLDTCDNIEVRAHPDGRWVASRLDIFTNNNNINTIWFEDLYM